MTDLQLSTQPFAAEPIPGALTMLGSIPASSAVEEATFASPADPQAETLAAPAPAPAASPGAGTPSDNPPPDAVDDTEAGVGSKGTPKKAKKKRKPKGRT